MPPAPPFNMPIQTCSGPIGGGGQRTAASWPSYAPVHTFFADAFPALARTLTGESPDRFGIYHYELGVCDFDGPSDAARAVAALTAACGSLAATTLALATRVGAPEDASAELLAARARLEDLLCFWRRTASGPAAAAAACAHPLCPSNAAGSRAAGRWTDAEHEDFLRLYAIHGRRWTSVAAEMPGRTEPQVRSHAQKHFQKEDRLDEERRGGAPAAALRERAKRPRGRPRGSKSGDGPPGAAEVLRVGGAYGPGPGRSLAANPSLARAPPALGFATEAAFRI